MPNFKNMKIIVNDQQPIDEIAKELERLGYKLNGWLENRIIRSMETNHFGLYSGNFFDVDVLQGDLTSLIQLKNMGKNDGKN